jgi:hypothetical protein
MCIPPFVQPAHHALGCLRLKAGAKIVLLLDMLYGGIMLLVHFLLLEGAQVQQSAAQALEQQEDRRLRHRHLRESHATDVELGLLTHRGWFLKLMALDFGWSHRLLDFNNVTNFQAGLFFGIITIVVCSVTLAAILQKWPNLPKVLRYCVVFMHLQIVLFVLVALLKLQKMCTIQAEYHPSFGPDSECYTFKIMWFQRVLIVLAVGTMGTWIFSSFAFVLTFGHDAHIHIDRAEHHDDLDAADGDHHKILPDTLTTPPGQTSMATSMAPKGAGMASQMVGPTPVGSQMLGSRASVPPMPQRTSYRVGVMGPQPSQAETQALLRPGAAY